MAAFLLVASFRGRNFTMSKISFKLAKTVEYICNVTCKEPLYFQNLKGLGFGREQKRKEEMMVSMHFCTKNTLLALSTKQVHRVIAQSLTSQYFYLCQDPEHSFSPAVWRGRNCFDAPCRLFREASHSENTVFPAPTPAALVPANVLSSSFTSRPSL